MSRKIHVYTEGHKITWVEKVRDKCSDIYEDGKEWVMQHPAEAVTLATGIIAGAIKGAKCIQEDEHTNKTIYDRKLGMYWNLKRKPSANQRLEIERRHRSGELMGDILKDMKLLKR